MTPEEILAALGAERQAIADAEQAAAEHAARRDELIRAAFGTLLPRAAVAEAAGLAKARLYQIRDGRR